MATREVRRSAPASGEQLAAELREAAAAGSSVRVRGAGTKLGWGGDAAPDLELSTLRLDGILEHNAGDLTAVLQAGVRLADAQAAFASAGQMLALDPPDGGATVGGVVASGDSGPLRARYGGVRDLVVGIAVALSDGTVARAGGKVIKNVAGYDLAKLFAGSLGRLGAILELSVRLHPLPPATLTAVGRSADCAALGRAAAALAHAPLEHLGLDVRWEAGEGALLARFGGAVPGPQAGAAERLLREHGLEAESVEDDDALWARQRAGQRAAAGTAIRVSHLQTQLPELLRTAERHGASLVGRAALGLSWLTIEDGSPEVALEELRRTFAAAVVLDAPPGLRLDRHGPRDPGVAALERRVKERFDPAGALLP